MIEISSSATVPEHVDRLTPQFNVDSTGKISWVPGYIDYDANKYYRGKQVSSDEFNTENLKGVVQGNYLADSLYELLNKHLNDAIGLTFQSTYNLLPSYVKVFTTDDWGTCQEDGYYYITIPASEHGLLIDEDAEELERMNIDTNMFLLDTNGNFYEVAQVTIDTENNVTIYTDDNSLIGFIVIRNNDKSFAMAQEIVSATQIRGLSNVALSGRASDLVDYTKPDGTGIIDRILRNTANITAILTGEDTNENEVKVAKAVAADAATEAITAYNVPWTNGRINGVNVSTIFAQQGLNKVANAVLADRATADSAGDNIINSYAKKTGTYTSMRVGNANLADNATNAVVAQKALTDDLGRTISSTYPTGLIFTRETITVEMRVGDAENGTNTVDLFRDTGTTFTMGAFIAKNIDGSNKRVVIGTHVRQMSVGSNRTDYDYLFLRIEGHDIANYPNIVRLTSESYSDGNKPNTADRNSTVTINNKTFLRYNLFDEGYDFNNGHFICIELLG